MEKKKWVLQVKRFDTFQVEVEAADEGEALREASKQVAMCGVGGLRNEYKVLYGSAEGE